MTDDRAKASTGSTAPGDATTEVNRVTASPQQVAAGARRRRSSRTWARLVPIVTAVLTALTAVAALVLSLISTAQLNRRADMSLTMPSVLRIVQLQSRVEISVQPTFTVYQKTDLTSTVTSVRLSVAPPPQINSAPPYFYWADVIEYAYDTQTGNRVGRVLSDPTPIIVTQDKPQTLMLRFIATPAFLNAGKWEGTLTAERQGQSPLVSRFCIDISADNITSSQIGTLNAVVMRNDQSPLLTQTSNCYRSP